LPKSSEANLGGWKVGISGYIVGRSAEKIADDDGIKGLVKKLIK
jgi:hypothetical protein